MSVPCPQGLSIDNCTVINTAASADISGLIYDADTPPTPIDTSVLPQELKNTLQRCDGDGTTACKLVMYDFNTNIGTTANSADYLIQLESDALSLNKSRVTVMSNVGTANTTSLGIPNDNLDLHYDANHLLSTPPIATGPIGFSSIGATIDGSGTQNAATTLDTCAAACDTAAATCGGFNFSETSSCTLFPIVDKEFVVSSAYTGSNGQSITSLQLTLKTAVTGVTAGQKVTGLETYINGSVTIASASLSQITISFDSQVVYIIPANTQITISANRVPVTSNTPTHGYTSNKAHINNIGVNGGSSYGYSGQFNVARLNGLPTTVSTASPSVVSTTTVIRQLTLTFSSLPTPLPVISTAKLSFYVSAGMQSGQSGVIQQDPASITDSASTCKNNYTSKVPDACTATLMFNSANPATNTIIFDVPSGGIIMNAIGNTVKIYFTTVEFTVNLANGALVPSNRILGWTGTITLYTISVSSYTQGASTITAAVTLLGGINPPTIGMTGVIAGFPITVTGYSSGSITASITGISSSTTIVQNTSGTLGIFPVTVTGFTSSSITFSGPSTIPSIGVRPQTITLSDNNGSTCQDIKACNASTQRLLDQTSIRSFSTLDLVACASCPERAYLKDPLYPNTTTANLATVRQYLWYGNSGAYSCSGSLPSGASSFDETCTPVCTPSTDQNAVSVAYDPATSLCRITCRTGYRWNGTSCAPCPAVTSDNDTTYTQRPGTCTGTCTYTGRLANMTATLVSDADGSATDCRRSCNPGYLPSQNRSMCCSTATQQPLGTQVTSITSTDCSAVACSKDSPYGDDLYNTVSGGNNGLCTFICKAVTASSSTTSTVSTATGPTASLTFPVNWVGSGLATMTLPLSSGDLQTNIGIYTFNPANAALGMYNGTPSSYHLLQSGNPIVIGFPVFFQLTSINYISQSGTISNLRVQLYKTKTGIENVLDQTVTNSSSTFSIGAYGKKLVLTFTGSGSVAFQIQGSVIQNCLTICSSTGTLAQGVYPYYDDVNKKCTISCKAVALDPGTQVSFVPETCLATCSASSDQPTDTLVYADNTINDTRVKTIQSSDNLRRCHINSCPSLYTRYISSISTTLNNAGCCLTPRITDSTNVTLNSSGITWSYPSVGSNDTKCNLSCTLPISNPYNISVTVDQINKACIRTCPTVTAGDGVVLGTVNDDCNPNCTTTDPNATTSLTYTQSTSSSVCTKMCTSGFKGDTGATPNTTTSTPGTNPCCSDVGATNNTAVILSSGGICKSAGNSICSIIDNTRVNINRVVYNASQGSSPTCTIECKSVTKNPSSASTVLTTNYSSDGLCTLRCSSSVENSQPYITDASGQNAPQCTFACASNYYKPTNTYLCCENVIENTGTVATKSTTDCSFTCDFSSGYNTGAYTASVSGRSCVLGCRGGVWSYQPSGNSAVCCTVPTIELYWILSYTSSPTLADPCDFTCTSSDPLMTAVKTYTADTRSCTASCVSGYTLVNNQCLVNKLSTTDYITKTCGGYYIQPIYYGLRQSLNPTYSSSVGYNHLYKSNRRGNPPVIMSKTNTDAVGLLWNVFAQPAVIYSCKDGYSFSWYPADNKFVCTLNQYLINNYGQNAIYDDGTGDATKMC